MSIGIACIKQYEQLRGEILNILLGCWHHYLPHSHFVFKCTVPNFHTPFTSNSIGYFTLQATSKISKHMVKNSKLHL